MTNASPNLDPIIYKWICKNPIWINSAVLTERRENASSTSPTTTLKASTDPNMKLLSTTKNKQRPIWSNLYLLSSISFAKPTNLPPHNTQAPPKKKPKPNTSWSPLQTMSPLTKRICPKPSSKKMNTATLKRKSRTWLSLKKQVKRSTKANKNWIFVSRKNQSYQTLSCRKNTASSWNHWKNSPYQTNNQSWKMKLRIFLVMAIGNHKTLIPIYFKPINQ